MAYLIECDRCGSTKSITSSMSIPPQWMKLPEIWPGQGSVDVMKAPVEAGVFCEGCVRALRDWRRPIPKAMPDKAA